MRMIEKSIRDRDVGLPDKRASAGQVPRCRRNSLKAGTEGRFGRLRADL
jgi:hypothetical protein